MALGLWTLWAVLASMVTTFVLGLLWYGPVIGKPYMRLTGMDKMTQEELEASRKAAMPGYALSVGLTGLGAVVIAFLFNWAFPGSGYADPWVFGISLGTAGWLAFYVPGTLTNIFFDKKPFGLWLINAGFWGLVGVASGLYVGLFHPGFA
jgi:hypothetical protein